MITIIVGKTKKYEVLIDDEDYDLVSAHKWSISTSRNGRRIYIQNSETSIHRLIMNAVPGQLVDHKNHNGLDNRKENLRICTKSQNCSNRRPKENASSKYLGVAKSGKRWMAAVGKFKQRSYLGQFDSEIEAALAYNEKAKELHGEFANLNVI